MINQAEYSKRRQALMQKIGPDGMVILPAASEKNRNGDAVYAYRQNSDFYYLTGFDEPEALLVLIPNRKEGEYILFNRVRDPERETWDGPRAGQEGAVNTFHANQAFPISQLSSLLPELMAGKDVIHCPLGLDASFDKTVMRCVNKIRGKIRAGLRYPTAFVDVSSSLHEMRIFKSPAEIEMMQKAADITVKAHIQAMKRCRPGMYEYQLEAEIMYEFLRSGARAAAYNSIVGAGKNSCVLHYVNNTQEIKEGDIVLIDAGAEYHNYAADVTRTFPANGKFSPEQRDIYELVLASQLAAIQSTKPGVSWTTAQDVIVKILTQGLVDLGILKGKVDELIEKEAYLPFYMHRSGHWLGLDVHDAGRYRVGDQWRALEPGMVFTIEPGLYIASTIPGVHERWHHIGVRIEDDVLVTKNGCDVLSKAAPKTITEIEATMAS